MSKKDQFESKTKLVAEGYNKIATVYTSSRKELRIGKYLTKFIKMMPAGGEVLDIGCGTGREVDDKLVKAGLMVRGIDFAEKMIEIARKNNPRVSYEVRDMRSLVMGEYQTDGIVCLYAMFHIPREEQQQVLRIIASYLKSGSPLLITMGDREFEGEHELFGAKMWSSQWGIEHNLKLVERAGFEITFSTIDKSGREKHLVLIARKR